MWIGDVGLCCGIVKWSCKVELMEWNWYMELGSGIVK
ncbi:hypothetical protein LINPERHAP1_LOCUS15707 [Linum perenne]